MPGLNNKDALRAINLTIPLFYGGEEFFGCFRRKKGFLCFFALGMMFAIGNREFPEISGGLFVAI
jgi:hypothetical protein